tara:strand:+ start:11682 stop:12758 length:1077 start_codon:yes stop_codon:yes gene_type:complete
MASTTATITFDRLYSTTAAIHRKSLAMEIVQSNALLWHMYRQGAVTYSGGTEVRQPVVLEQSANIGAIGLYSTFSTTPEDGPTIARYPKWYKNRASVVFDETELGQNSGPEQILDLLKTKLAISKQSMVNDLNRQLYADNAATPLELNGLQSGFIEFRTPATQVGVVGSINKATNPNWRNQYGTITTFSTDGLRVWEQVYMDCSDSGTHPDIMMTDPQVYRFFKELVAPNQERKDSALWNQGFDNLLFNNTAVVPEPQLAGTGQTYFLTTTGRRMVSDFNLKPEYFKAPGKNPAVKGSATGVGLQLAILRKDDFRMTDFRYPPDSDTLLAHLFFTGMLVTSSEKRQGGVDFGANPISF